MSKTMLMKIVPAIIFLTASPLVTDVPATVRITELPIGEERKFETAKWCSNERRLDMLKDLMFSGLKDNLSKGDLENLLGAPDEDQKTVWKYSLNKPRNSLWLELRIRDRLLSFRLNSFSEDPICGSWFTPLKEASSVEGTNATSEGKVLAALSQQFVQAYKEKLDRLFDNQSEIQFNPENWSNKPAQRADMIFSLFRSAKLVGMTKTSIQEMLGSPSCTTILQAKKQEVSESTDSDFYDLDNNSSSRRYLQIVYSRNVVTRYRIVCFTRKREFHSTFQASLAEKKRPAD